MVDAPAPAPMRLLLFSLVIRGSLLLAVRSYKITVPCEEDLVCYHMWNLNEKTTKDYVAVATTGLIRAGSKMSECDQPIEYQGDGNVQICTNGTQVPLGEMDFPKISLTPGKAASLQCVLLAYGRRNCTGMRGHLTWLDEAGAEVQADSEHRLERVSDCNVTLTVNFKSPGVKKLKCRAIVWSQVKALAELWVTVPAPKGKGRVLVEAPGPDQKLPETGGKQGVVGTALGVAGCAVAIAAVAAFVVRRKRRSRNRLPGGPESSRSNNEDVVYADVILPEGSGQALVREDTEYACVQPK